jgi:hypothetical protein
MSCTDRTKEIMQKHNEQRLPYIVENAAEDATEDAATAGNATAKDGVPAFLAVTKNAATAKDVVVAFFAVTKNAAATKELEKRLERLKEKRLKQLKKKQ